MTSSNDADGKKELMGIITCPKCGHKQILEIPTYSCQAMYQCEECMEMISAEKTCCVFCDYGDRKCPVAGENEK